MRDGIIYFFVCTAYNIYDMIQIGPTINNAPELYINAIYSVFLYTIVPRFIISIRELYDHEAHYSWKGVDTGFGVLSQCVVRVNGGASMTSISFADDDLLLENDSNGSDVIVLEVVSGVDGDKHQV